MIKLIKYEPQPLFPPPDVVENPNEIRITDELSFIMTPSGRITTRYTYTTRVSESTEQYAPTETQFFERSLTFAILKELRAIRELLSERT